MDDKNYLWTLKGDKTIHIINTESHPLFDLTDISVLFEYEPELVYHHFHNQITAEDHDGPNQTFMHTEDGIYVSILIPLVLCKAAILDGMDEHTAYEIIGELGRVVEEIMEDGHLYMDAMTKVALDLLKEAYGD